MRRNRKVLLLISILGFFVSALTVVLLPYTGGGSENTMSFIDVLVGALFWIGIIVGIVFYTWVWLIVRKDIQFHKVKLMMKPAFQNFGSNTEAMITDIIFLVAVAGVIVSIFVPNMPDILILTCLFFMIYNFCMHFVLNGRVYKYVFKRKRERKEKKCEKGLNE